MPTRRSARASGIGWRLCRYVLRPPLACDALELTEDGKVVLRLRRPWSDGTYAIRFEPSELLERLAAMIPRPRANQLIYHGAYAPRGVVHERAWSAARPPQGGEVMLAFATPALGWRNISIGGTFEDEQVSKKKAYREQLELGVPEITGGTRRRQQGHAGHSVPELRYRAAAVLFPNGEL